MRCWSGSRQWRCRTVRYTVWYLSMAYRKLLRLTHGEEPQEAPQETSVRWSAALPLYTQFLTGKETQLCAPATRSMDVRGRLSLATPRGAGFGCCDATIPGTKTASTVSLQGMWIPRSASRKP